MSSIFEEDFIIKYDDINPNANTVSDIALLRFFQEIAGKHADSVGYGFSDISSTKLTFLVLAWKFKIYDRPIYGDKITIKTWPRKSVKSIYYRDFEIYKNNIKIGIATSKWVLINTDTHNMILNNFNILAKLPPNNNSVFEEEIKKIPIPEDFNNIFKYKILRRDIDTNNHVNNTVYLSLAYECLPEEIYNNLDYNLVEIMYKSEATLNNEIIAKFSQIDKNCFIVVISDVNSDDLHCVIKYTKI